jgi:hypothetical protein
LLASARELGELPLYIFPSLQDYALLDRAGSHQMYLRCLA